MEESKVQHLRPLEENSSPSVLHAVELKFSVPWGHIAAKAWGDLRGERILAVHGLADSAATFDTLIPMLLQLVAHPLYIGRLGVIHAGRQYCVYMAFRTMPVLSTDLFPFFQLHSIVCVLIYLAMVIHHISQKGSLWT